MEIIRLFDCIPSKNIEIGRLSLGWCAMTKTYVKQGTILYNLKYKLGKTEFAIEYRAPRDVFYVHNGECKNHAKWYYLNYCDTEPILCELWDSEEEYNNNLKTEMHIKPPVYTSLDEEDYNCSFQEENNISENECYTYLMKDESNGYYKIGMSNNPTFREHTLQSEKPTISLYWKRKFSNRGEARQLEKQLHEMYKCKRIRGEWFNLSQIDINNIIASFSEYNEWNKF